MGSAPVPFHVGTVVDDLDAAIDRWTALGVAPWVRSEWKHARYYDGMRDVVVTARSRVAFGRMGDGMALELIEPDLDGEVPDAWRLAGGAVGHIGFWTPDPRPAAMELVREGGRLVLARAGDGLEDGARAAADDPAWLPDRLDTSYVAAADGSIIEFVPSAIWEDRLPALLGAAVRDVVLGPPGSRGDGSGPDIRPVPLARTGVRQYHDHSL